MGGIAVVNNKVLSRSDRIFNFILYAVLTAAFLVCLLPLLYVISVSITPYSEVLRNGGFILIPRRITLEAYEIFWRDGQMLKSFGVTIFITVVGTALNIVLTLLLAYPLSKRELPGSRFFMLYVLFTMLFSGGIVPKYLIVKNLGLIDSLWSLIFPIAIAPYNVILMRTFFHALPEELFEASLIDGAGETRTLVSIAIPLALPSIMTNVMFYGVMHWNTFMSALLYITDQTKQPLQVLLYSILKGSEAVDAVDYTAPTETLKMAAVVLTALPIVIVYPFIQKYFTQGMLVGAIKG